MGTVSCFPQLENQKSANYRPYNTVSVPWGRLIYGAGGLWKVVFSAVSMRSTFPNIFSSAASPMSCTTSHLAGPRGRVPAGRARPPRH